MTVAGWRAGYRDIVSPERLANLPTDRWRHEIGVGLRRPVEDAFTCVAEIDGAFAGYCYVAAPSNESDLGRAAAELGALYVDPVHWRKGAGDALVRATLERLAALPYGQVVLWTFRENAPAIALYERHGWRLDGAEKIHARSGEPAVRFSRPVTMDAR
ncbi:MAG: GNAT family N-acetyltransferase [Solirubrobacterales bacterium]